MSAPDAGRHASCGVARSREGARGRNAAPSGKHFQLERARESENREGGDLWAPDVPGLIESGEAAPAAARTGGTPRGSSLDSTAMSSNLRSGRVLQDTNLLHRDEGALGQHLIQNREKLWMCSSSSTTSMSTGRSPDRSTMLAAWITLRGPNPATPWMTVAPANASRLRRSSRARWRD
jgi:hypothetical protein